ncbi:hypothetical protein [Acidisoma cladoniae]|uniref:hypothetical protein n=1 Tax=Acidisoma cladoniae TaxID=3040935 RepID=UPI00254A83AE|nr:hypothetical protein [Acidisoma sp. PAMC 29798]
MSGGIQVPVAARINTIVYAADEVAIAVLSPGHLSLEDVLSRPGMSALLTHDEGVNWPDRTGCSLATVAFRAGRAVIFKFRSMADASTSGPVARSNAGRCAMMRRVTLSASEIEVLRDWHLEGVGDCLREREEQNALRHAARASELDAAARKAVAS